MATSLLGADRQRSVLRALPYGSRAYSPYGVMHSASPPTLAFCGQYRDALTGLYPLGNGHRYYQPSLMRFLSPDTLSPFDEGGLNAYCYCLGDPVNHHDPSAKSAEDVVLPILAGITNLFSGFISWLKFRTMSRDRKLTSATGGYPASRTGEVTYSTPENPIAKPTRLAWTMSAISAGAALAGLGFSIARIVEPENDDYLWVTVGLTATGLFTSGVEAWQLIGSMQRNRYPIESLKFTRRSRESSLEDVHSNAARIRGD
ncbi:RHS repeat-associated core domain-containing protein [Pseudomonas sp. NEEL19]|uniref:RHS repeat-associated core domain-containing protein n=1 Tax=Pseudomonas sp. NEEL19 TaxID=2867409 RepID=UPI002367935C|nr:RHS repeat-associated core domain-containing protein [Pseudomonas sp. NEEL19]WDM59644.1 RHS repeat-associated core domain-containing protein [Pseudomonas sp. NEEL19]